MLTSVVSDAGTDEARAEDVWFTCFSLCLRMRVVDAEIVLLNSAEK